MDSQNFEFDHWPLRDEWRVSVPLSLSLLAIASGAAFAMSNLTVGVGVLLALVICTWEMWLPSHVQLDRTGVRVRPPLGRLRWMPWPNVAVCEIHPRGFLLRTTAEHVPLFVRGLFIRSGSFHNELLQLIRYHRPECLGERNELEFEVKLPPVDPQFAELEPASTDIFPEEPTAKSMNAPVGKVEPATEDSQAP